METLSNGTRHMADQINHLDSVSLNRYHACTADIFFKYSITLLDIDLNILSCLIYKLCSVFDDIDLFVQAFGMCFACK